MCKMPKVLSTVVGPNRDIKEELDLKKLALFPWKYQCS